MHVTWHGMYYAPHVLFRKEGEGLRCELPHVRGVHDSGQYLGKSSDGDPNRLKVCGQCTVALVSGLQIPGWIINVRIITNYRLTHVINRSLINFPLSSVTFDPNVYVCSAW